jgi:two-component system chemotaxis response regulator CheB
VVGVSSGGVHALKTILSGLPARFPSPIAVVHHVAEDSDGFLAEHLNATCEIAVKEAEDKEPLCPGMAYLAPAGYHLLVEQDRTFSLSVDDRVKFSRPAIDVLFESAADAFRDCLIGIVLTGANEDGAKGLKAISIRGGLTIVQDPKTAEAQYMPRAAIAATPVDHIVALERVAPLLLALCASPSGGNNGSNAANG